LITNSAVLKNYEIFKGATFRSSPELMQDFEISAEHIAGQSS